MAVPRFLQLLPTLLAVCVQSGETSEANLALLADISVNLAIIGNDMSEQEVFIFVYKAMTDSIVALKSPKDHFLEKFAERLNQMANKITKGYMDEDFLGTRKKEITELLRSVL